MSLRSEEFKNLCLCFQNTISVSQILQMAGTDIRDHAGVRSCNLRKSGHLTEITDPHFQNCNFISITQTENCERQTKFIVKVALCFQSMVFLVQNRCDHFFCTCLTNTSCNSHNRDLKLL